MYQGITLWLAGIWCLTYTVFLYDCPFSWQFYLIAGSFTTNHNIVQCDFGLNKITFMLGFLSAWVSKTDGMSEHEIRVAEIRNTYKILVCKLLEKRSVDTETYVWVEVIILKMTLIEIGVNNMNWIDLVQYKFTWWAYVTSVVNLYVWWQHKQLNNYHRQSLYFGVSRFLNQ